MTTLCTFTAGVETGAGADLAPSLSVVTASPCMSSSDELGGAGSSTSLSSVESERLDSSSSGDSFSVDGLTAPEGPASLAVSSNDLNRLGFARTSSWRFFNTPSIAFLFFYTDNEIDDPICTTCDCEQMA